MLGIVANGNGARINEKGLAYMFICGSVKRG